MLMKGKSDMITEIIFAYHFKAGKSDKIWGIVKQSENVFYAFWGRTGKKLQFQDFPPYRWEQHEMAQKKAKKGYCKISDERLNELQEDFDSQFLMSVLGGAKAKADYVNPNSRSRQKETF